MNPVVPESHPLRKLLVSLTEKTFTGQVGIQDQDITQYVSNILVDFCSTERLHKVRDARGRPLSDVGEMLVESHPLLEAGSFDREREVRKHIGDYTLFLAGMFPEYLHRRSRRFSMDYFVDYIQTGKESYRIVAEFDYGPYKKYSQTFRKLAENFDFCVVGLHFVRDELDRMQHSAVLYARRVVAGEDDVPELN